MPNNNSTNEVKPIQEDRQAEEVNHEKKSIPIELKLRSDKDRAEYFNQKYIELSGEHILLKKDLEKHLNACSEERGETTVYIMGLKKENEDLQERVRELTDSLKSVFNTIGCNDGCRVHGNVSKSYCVPHGIILKALEKLSQPIQQK